MTGSDYWITMRSGEQHAELGLSPPGPCFQPMSSDNPHSSFFFPPPPHPPSIPPSSLFYWFFFMASFSQWSGTSWKSRWATTPTKERKKHAIKKSKNRERDTHTHRDRERQREKNKKSVKYQKQCKPSIKTSLDMQLVLLVLCMRWIKPVFIINRLSCGLSGTEHLCTVSSFCTGSACVRACMHACVLVCVCVCEREERERDAHCAFLHYYGHHYYLLSRRFKATTKQPIYWYKLSCPISRCLQNLVIVMMSKQRRSTRRTASIFIRSTTS